MQNNPIGILDSGSGGLTVMAEIARTHPGESLLYFGDHKFLPYSEKSTKLIQSRVKKIIKFFIHRKVKLIVIACNTATVAGIDNYRKSFPEIPILGVVPVVKTAAKLSVSKRFAVLSTVYTASSDYQNNLIMKYASDCFVVNDGSKNLVGLIETGELNSPEVNNELEKILKPILKFNIDTLALGCTHFPFLKSKIQAIVGNKIRILDSAGAVNRQLDRIMEHNNLASGLTKGRIEYFTSGDDLKIRPVIERLLQKKVRVTTIEL